MSKFGFNVGDYLDPRAILCATAKAEEEGPPYEIGPLTSDDTVDVLSYYVPVVPVAPGPQETAQDPSALIKELEDFMFQLNNGISVKIDREGKIISRDS